MADSAPETATLRDPYEVLGLERTATPEEIKAAYRKQALKWHPDKNQGAGAAEAADRFREVTTAYGILSDEEKKLKYDTAGYEGLEAGDMEMEIDLSQMGVVHTAVAAMFSKLGVKVKTAVAPHVLEMAYEGNFKAQPLYFGEAIADKVDKQGVQFYEVELTQDHIESGFVVSAHSAAGSKFKLLLFEEAPDGQWELVVQEDSSKVRKFQAAGLYFLQFGTYSIGPEPRRIEFPDDPEALLFRRLHSMKARDTVSLRPGKILVAVYGDNWFKRVHYSIQAVVPGRGGEAGWLAAEQVRRVEADLLAKRQQLAAFEAEYRQAQAQYLAACQQFEQHSSELGEMMLQREDAYLSLMQVEGRGGAADQIASRVPSMSQSRKSLFSRTWNNGFPSVAGPGTPRGGPVQAQASFGPDADAENGTPRSHGHHHRRKSFSIAALFSGRAAREEQPPSPGPRGSATSFSRPKSTTGRHASTAT